MIGALIRRVIGAPPAQSSWNMYRNYVSVHPTAIIDPCASIKIFNPPDPPEICLEIGEGCHIFSTFSLLRPQARITVGRRCQLGNTHFVCAESISVGDDVLMAWGITLSDSDNHSIYWDERQYDVERCRRDYVATGGQDLARTHDWSGVQTQPVLIGDKAWIGFNAIVLKGVEIGEGSIIGAGSVVVQSIPPWTIASGNPCRGIRNVSPDRPK